MDQFSLSELSEQADIPPRTIRYYIAQGLLPGPLGSGRGAVYGKAHLQQLNRIKALQEQGKTLAEVAFALLPQTDHHQMPEPVAWLEYKIADDLVVLMRGGIAPWRHKIIRKVLAEAAAKLQSESEHKETE